MTQAALGYLLLAASFSKILIHLSFFFMISLVIMEGRHASTVIYCDIYVCAYNIS
jgi:hypothetical protein